MALPDLLAAIEADAAAEAARLRAERTTAAAAILADAGQQAADLQAAAVAAAESQERRAGKLRLAAARAAASNRILDAREAACQQILGDVRAELGAIRGRGDYPEILAGLIAEARDMLPGCVTLRVDPADEALARRLLHGDDKLRVEPVLSSAGGAEVTDGAGATAINTVEARLAAAEPVLRALIGGLLRDGPAGRAEQAPEAEAGPA
ncbi:MAG TPA: V-type ATP synthase subunit E family protein [Streptosporangiaceae bacterium]|nr:V-type ATP synthase subunit E family protein [Streptosporangiaceae bacterium]